jgi:CubicO group peptidase (beta-lactamase class C family)
MDLSSVDERNPLLGNSGILSSPEDLHRFAFSLQKLTILSSEDRNSILQKTILTDSVSEDPIAFGEGVYVGEYFYWSYGKENQIANFYYHDIKSRIFIQIVSPYGGTKGDLSSIKSLLTEIIFQAKQLKFSKPKNNKPIDPNFVYLEDLMKEEKVPSLGIAVFKNYKLQWKKNYGTKSNETLFRAGSLSKTVTAAATLRLVEQGKLDLYSNWVTKLKSYNVGLPNQKKKPIVNLDLLLSHTSGLTEKGNWDDPINKNKKKLKDLKDTSTKESGNGLRLYYKPGTKSRYSGGGYSIVQEILSEVSKQKFTEVSQENVFVPLKMKRSTFEQNLDEYEDRCDGYDEKGNLLPQKIFVTPELSSGGLWTTSEEIGTLFIEIAKSKKGKSEFLSEESAKYLLSPKMSAANLTVHALVAHGFFLNRTGRTEYFFHGGHTKGHKSLALFNADRGYGIVIMTNSENGSKLIWRILRAISVAEKWDKFVN